MAVQCHHFTPRACASGSTCAAVRLRDRRVVATDTPSARASASPGVELDEEEEAEAEERLCACLGLCALLLLACAAERFAAIACSSAAFRRRFNASYAAS